MNITEFMATLYLGDRYLKEIVIDSNNKEVKLKINDISRIRGEDGIWNYYTDEDIEDGYMVFSHVESFSIEPLGLIPNDEICDCHITEQDGIYDITFYITAYGIDNKHNQTTVKFMAKEMCLEDPKTNERIYT